MLNAIAKGDAEAIIAWSPYAIAVDKKTRADNVDAGLNSMEVSGIEPLTPCLQSRCSPS